MAANTVIFDQEDVYDLYKFFDDNGDHSISLFELLEGFDDIQKLITGIDDDEEDSYGYNFAKHNIEKKTDGIFDHADFEKFDANKDGRLDKIEFVLQFINLPNTDSFFEDKEEMNRQFSFNHRTKEFDIVDKLQKQLNNYSLDLDPHKKPNKVFKSTDNDLETKEIFFFFDVVDDDGNGYLDEKEFSVTLGHVNMLHDNVDCDRDGVEPDEIRRFFNEQLDDASVNQEEFKPVVLQIEGTQCPKPPYHEFEGPEKYDADAGEKKAKEFKIREKEKGSKSA